MNNLLQRMSGRKTYIVAAVYALCTILTFIGIPIPGFTPGDSISDLLIATGAASLRNAIN